MMCTFEEFLLQLCLCDLDFDSLIDLLGVSLLVVGVVLNRGREKCVDERSLSQTRLTGNLYINCKPSCPGCTFNKDS